MTRREFLRGVLKGAPLAIVAAVPAVLVKRATQPVRTGELLTAARLKELLS